MSLGQCGYFSSFLTWILAVETHGHLRQCPLLAVRGADAARGALCLQLLARQYPFVITIFGNIP